MSFGLILLVAVAAIAVPTIAWAVWDAKRNGPRRAAQEQEFFRATGYVRREVDAAGAAVEPGDTYFEKSHPLGALRYVMRGSREGQTVRSEGYWRLDLATPRAHGGVQIVDRKIAPQGATAAAGKAAADAFFRSQRMWKQLFPGPVPLGNAELDARFVAFTDHPPALAAMASDPELVRLLQSCPELDLCLTPTAVVFGDPALVNLGGLMSAASIPRGPDQMHQESIAAHLHVQRVLERAIELTETPKALG